MLRVIAGSARGRRFEAPEGRDTRPTLDRVRENAAAADLTLTEDERTLLIGGSAG